MVFPINPLLFKWYLYDFFTLRPICSNLPSEARLAHEEYYDRTTGLKSPPRPLRIQIWGMISQKAR